MCEYFPTSVNLFLDSAESAEMYVFVRACAESVQLRNCKSLKKRIQDCDQDGINKKKRTLTRTGLN